MKYIVLIPDGSADQPQHELGGMTPLQAAKTPCLDRLAQGGLLGLALTVPEGFPPGSDVANLSIMGYDPHRFYTGRAPLEAASLGIELGSHDIAFRCNLVWVDEGKMKDFAAGHISNEEAAELISFLQEKLGSNEVAFHQGLSYRHLMVTHDIGGGADCTPPHDITGQEIAGFLPKGAGSKPLREMMSESSRLLSGHPVNEKRIQEGKAPANMIWLWGQGTAPDMPTLAQRFGISGAVISAVDLVKGLGKYAGLEIIDVPGATGYLDTDYGAKAKYALEALARHDFVYIHVEAPDEASHMGDVREKVKAIERFDLELLEKLLKGLESIGPHRIIALPDHATPLATMTHSADPVPFLLYDSRHVAKSKNKFSEVDAARAGKTTPAWKLLAMLVERE
jgi:2,3-bisphosphoglycerate-independent phosphoglycerate mutase